jgi:hypothetical protein|tara:strand:- start:234 stop:350 length:117 start_codon:yes stop_codon:yes gene_type:complete
MQPLDTFYVMVEDGTQAARLQERVAYFRFSGENELVKV